MTAVSLKELLAGTLRSRQFLRLRARVATMNLFREDCRLPSVPSVRGLFLQRESQERSWNKLATAPSENLLCGHEALSAQGGDGRGCRRRSKLFRDK